MRIHLDKERCSGYGMCVDAAPSLFELDDSGLARLRVEDGTVPDGDDAAALAAEQGCPERAINHTD
jgi:ferredoxin